LAFGLPAITLADGFALCLPAITFGGGLALGSLVLACDSGSGLADSAKAPCVRESAAKTPNTAHHLIVIVVSQKLKNFVL